MTQGLVRQAGGPESSFASPFSSATPIFAVVFGLGSLGLAAASCRTEDGVTVYAAASLQPALEHSLRHWSGQPLTMSYAASSTLAKQIDAGARADVFISAHPQWVDWADNRGLVADRHPFAHNELVVFAVDTAPAVADLASADCVAVGDPDHVPVGMHAKKALDEAGLWAGLGHQLVPTLDAPAAVRTVKAGVCSMGIAYRTDIGSGLQLGERIVTDSPLLYEAVEIVGSSHASAVMGWLNSPEVQATLADHGFRPGESTP